MIDTKELRQSLGAVQPEEVAELLDRLEEVEKERDWNAERLEDAIEECTALRARIEATEELVRELQRNLSSGMWRVLREENEALSAKLEAAEKERTIDEQRIADLMAELNRVGQENEELRAKRRGTWKSCSAVFCAAQRRRLQHE